MARSLQSMLIAASTTGHFIHVVSEGDTLYMGKNPRDAFQVIRDMEEVEVSLVNPDKTHFDWAYLLPGDTEAYICDCTCGGFFDNWEI
jgi:hypothetical protein